MDWNGWSFTYYAALDCIRRQTQPHRGIMASAFLGRNAIARGWVDCNLV